MKLENKSFQKLVKTVCHRLQNNFYHEHSEYLSGAKGTFIAKRLSMLLVTSPFGLSSILGKELKILGYNPQDTFSTGTFIDLGLSAVYDINLRSRIANKVYLLLGKSPVKTFDQLFDFVKSLDISPYFLPGQKISISATSHNSQLSSIPSIQSITQKSIIKKISQSDSELLSVDPDKAEFEIFVFLQDDLCQVFVNTSGISLHNRGYRKQTLDAPIKENVAAGLVLLSGRKFKENFYDPFCGSGTICIEAAMIAKNMPPGVNRSFAFQDFPNFDLQMFSKIKEKALSKVFTSKTYQIFGYDIDPLAIKISNQNAINAGVDDTIIFEKKDFLSIPELSGHMLSNPPYGKRLQDFDLAPIYSHIDKLFSSPDLTGGIITSYDGFQNIINKSDYSLKSIFNGADTCSFYNKTKANNQS